MKRVQIMVDDWQADVLKKLLPGNKISWFIRDSINRSIVDGCTYALGPKNHYDLDYKARKMWSASKMTAEASGKSVARR